MGISNLSFSATNINVGLDADKSATPREGDLYIATDTEILYRCYADDTWTSDELTEAKIDAVKPNISCIASGSFPGNDTTNRAIAHGLGGVPKIVFLQYEESIRLESGVLVAGELITQHNAGSSHFAHTVADSTNFYIGNASNYTYSFNNTDATTRWTVML